MNKQKYNQCIASFVVSYLIFSINSWGLLEQLGGKSRTLKVQREKIVTIFLLDEKVFGREKKSGSRNCENWIA